MTVHEAIVFVKTTEQGSDAFDKALETIENYVKIAEAEFSKNIKKEPAAQIVPGQTELTF